MQLSLGGSWGWKQPARNRGMFAGIVQTSHANRAATKTIHLTAATGSETKAPCSFSPRLGREGKKEDKAPEQVCKLPIK